MHVCVPVSMPVVVCFICKCMQAHVVLRVDKRLDGDKYLVSCELHGFLLLIDEALSGFTIMSWRGRVTEVKGFSPGGLVKVVKQNQAVIFLYGFCSFSVIDWYCLTHWKCKEKARSGLTLLPQTTAQNVNICSRQCRPWWRHWMISPVGWDVMIKWLKCI